MSTSARLDFQPLFEATPGLYLVLSPDFTIVAVNDAYLNATMTKRDEILGRNLFEVFPDNPDDPTADGVSNLRFSLCYVLNNKSIHNMSVQKYDIRKPDGTFEVRYWNPVNKPVFNVSGEVIYIIHSVEDVTEFVQMKIDSAEKELVTEGLRRKVIEHTKELESNLQQLKESEEKFQKAFQASAAGIAITRLSDSTFLDVNDAFVKMTGYSKKELIGHTSAEVGMIANDKLRNEVLQHVREYGSAKPFEVTVCNKAGDIINVLSSVETILLSGEKYAINIIYDITDRKKAEQQLEDANKELEAFTYSVAHDLRAPLRIISGYSTILVDEYHETLDQEGQRLLKIIATNAGRMGQLIDDLLEFSRLGRSSLNLRLTNVEDLINSILEEQLALLAESRIEFKIGKLEPLNCDGNLMQHVFSNLISNAIKYSRTVKKPVIELGSIKEDNEIVYFIKDNGIGFDMQYADKLFGVFQRLHNVTKIEGTGVGLAIVKRVISKHQGKVWVEAEVDRGATFYFSLPAIPS